MDATEWIAGWLSPATIDWILVGLALEFFVLWRLLVRWSSTQWVVPLFSYLCSGALLLVAVRVSLAKCSVLALASVLGLSGIAHLSSLWLMRRRILEEHHSMDRLDPELCWRNE